MKKNVSEVFVESGEFKLLKWKGLGCKTKHIVQHSCGYEWEVNYASFTLNGGCPNCAGHVPITEAKCRQIFEESGEFQLLKWKGLGCKTKHLARHSCGYEWNIIYHDFNNGEGRVVLIVL